MLLALALGSLIRMPGWGGGGPALTSLNLVSLPRSGVRLAAEGGAISVSTEAPCWPLLCGEDGMPANKTIGNYNMGGSILFVSSTTISGESDWPAMEYYYTQHQKAIKSSNI